MKLLHLSDLHLGKRVYDFPMLEDQEYILKEILRIVGEEKPDGVLIAGDVYDKSVPAAEAVNLLDWFLRELAGRETAVFLISGNHDSSERLAFASALLRKSRVYISPAYHGDVEPIAMRDEFGEVNFYLLPFLKPGRVRGCFPEEKIDSYTDAVDCAVRHMEIDTARRNVLLTHQFVTGAERSGSEELSVGGSDNVDVSVFAPFDYVALGHIHGPQNLDGDRVRYCGTPLKYSISEAKHAKSVTVVELGKKGERTVRTIPLSPMRDMLDLKGTYDEVTAREFYQNFDQDAYIRITLTDENDIPDAMGKLRAIYPNLMTIGYDNARTRGGGERLPAEAVDRMSPLELFSAFYQQQNGSKLSEEQEKYLAGLVEEIWDAGGGGK
ncbi:MAG: exonuclease SbcCD subunit D [Acutalibacter sp.]|nr:exonuclease SbcCD subunit D [Acutalibacter sp.]